MNKEDVKALLSYCYLCDNPFILEQGGLDTSWTFANLDGEWVPVCWGCAEEIECGV